jgi:hypothetical protein
MLPAGYRLGPKAGVSDLFDLEMRTLLLGILSSWMVSHDRIAIHGANCNVAIGWRATGLD